MWLHRVGAAAAALRYSALDGPGAPVVLLTGMGLAARLVVVEAALAQGGGSISPWISGHGERRFVAHGHAALLVLEQAGVDVIRVPDAG